MLYIYVVCYIFRHWLTKKLVGFLKLKDETIELQYSSNFLATATATTPKHETIKIYFFYTINAQYIHVNIFLYLLSTA